MNIKLYEKAFAAAGVLGILATTGLAYCNYRFIENLKTPDVRRVLDIRREIDEHYNKISDPSSNNLSELEIYARAQDALSKSPDVLEMYKSLTAKPEVLEAIDKIKGLEWHYMSLLAILTLSGIGLLGGHRQLRKSLEDSLAYLTRRRK